MKTTSSPDWKSPIQTTLSPQTLFPRTELSCVNPQVLLPSSSAKRSWSPDRNSRFGITSPSNKRILFTHCFPHIEDEFLVSEPNKCGVRTIGPIHALNAGFKTPSIKHYTSHKRQVYIPLEDEDKLPASITTTIFGTPSIIWISTGVVKCFEFLQGGHIAKYCPLKPENTDGPSTRFQTLIADPTILSDTFTQPQDSNTDSAALLGLASTQPQTLSNDSAAGQKTLLVGLPDKLPPSLSRRSHESNFKSHQQERTELSHHHPCRQTLKWSICSRGWRGTRIWNSISLTSPGHPALPIRRREAPRKKNKNKQWHSSLTPMRMMPNRLRRRRDMPQADRPTESKLHAG